MLKPYDYSVLKSISLYPAISSTVHCIHAICCRQVRQADVCLYSVCVCAYTQPQHSYGAHTRCQNSRLYTQHATVHTACARIQSASARRTRIHLAAADRLDGLLPLALRRAAGGRGAAAAALARVVRLDQPVPPRRRLIRGRGELLPAGPAPAPA